MTKIIVKRKMKKVPKSILSVILMLAMLVSIFMPIGSVHAKNVDHGNLQDDYCFNLNLVENDYPVSSVTVNDGDWDTVDTHTYFSNNTIFTIVIIAGMKGNSYPAISTPGGFNIKDGGYGTYDARPNPDAKDDVEGDEYIFTLTVDVSKKDKGEAHCFGEGLSIVDGPEPVLEINKTAKLDVTINGSDLEWHAPSDEASHFTFGINDSDTYFLNSDNLEFIRENDEIISGSTIEDMQFDYTYDDSGEVTFHMHTNPSEYIYSITINGEPYETPNTREQLIAHYSRDNLCIDFDIEHVTYAEKYVVVIEGRHLTGDDQLTGGFGWNYSAEGDVDNATDRIPNGEIHFVSAVYDGVQYNTIQEMKLAGNLFEWVNAEKKDHYEIGDRSSFGYAYFPVGTVVTIEIVPYQGYQLVGLKEEHRNVIRGEEPGVYIFEIHGGGEALGVVFEPVDNEVRSNSEKIVSGTIDTDQVVDKGTIKLEVSDTNVSAKSREGFEEAADGYEISNYLDLSLYNTLYKGKKDQNNVYEAWDTPLNNLTKKASITLKVDENLEGKDVVIVHEEHDDDELNYQVIEVVKDDQESTITFETDSFSNYAVAYRNTNNEPENPPACTDPNGCDNECTDPNGCDNECTDPNGCEPQNPDNDTVRVTFDTRGGSEVPYQDVKNGEHAVKPEDPTNGDLIFGGWYFNEACTDPFDFDEFEPHEPLTIFAKWNEQYEIEALDGSAIEFAEEENHEYQFSIFNYLDLSKEEILELSGMPEDMYDQIFGGIIEDAKEKGTLLGIFEIDVFEEIDEDGSGSIEDEERHYLHDGPFKIKIKLTEEMKKYNKFVLGYVNDDYTIAEMVELSVEGDYLVGTLEHLSAYALIGDVVEDDNPGTNDNISLYVTILGFSVAGLVLAGIYTKKRFNK